MAIDFMVMPLSRYLAGDFITPNMHASWETGVPYVVFGPAGRREFPEGQPFGGPTSAEERARFAPLVLDDLKAAPGPAWDESSTTEPRFHRPDARSYQAFLAHCEAPPPSRLFGLRKGPAIAHAHQSLFFPMDFDAPITLESPFPDRAIGSVPRALEELARTTWPEDAMHAVSTLIAALHDAQRLVLPVVVDS